MLSSHKFRKVYRTQYHDLPNEFYAPALRESSHYDRASGFFSVSALIELMPGLIPFITNGGMIRIVTSVLLSEESIRLIQEGHRLKESSVIEDLKQALQVMVSEPDDLNALDLITNLIACEKIVLRVAYMPDALYHEKFGILTDEAGNKLYFAGSPNETRNGITTNRESITVLTSWSGDEEAISDEEGYFESLWNNDSQGVKVIDFPEAVRSNLIKSYKTSETWEEAAEKILSSSTSKKRGFGSLCDKGLA